jgi:hypothetical protein
MDGTTLFIGKSIWVSKIMTKLQKNLNIKSSILRVGQKITYFVQQISVHFNLSWLA